MKQRGVRVRNKAKQRAYNKTYYQSNRKRLLAYQKAYNKSHKKQRQAYRDSHVKERKAYQLASKKNYLNYHLKHRYGITLEVRNALNKKQKGRCAICGERRKLNVDHDHKTGKVRGLLCKQCNYLLGNARDDCVILTNANKYLRKHRAT
jgi:hypothetical protein